MTHQASRGRRVIVIVAAVLCCSLLACAGYVAVATMRGEIPVAGGYRLFRADSRSIVLCDPRGFVIVGEQICEIGVADRLIIGRTVDPGADAYPGEVFPVGYFIVDLQTGKVTSGLTKEEFAKIAGASTAVTYRPSSWALWHW